MNMVKALYELTKAECWVNMDYVIDVFQSRGTTVKAYTFDNERGAYLIDQAEFEKWNRREGEHNEN